MVVTTILRPELLRQLPRSVVSHLLEAQRDVALLRLLDNRDNTAPTCVNNSAAVFVSVSDLLRSAVGEQDHRLTVPPIPQTAQKSEVSVVYEVVRVRQGRPLFLRGHIARLMLSIAIDMQADTVASTLVERLTAHASDALERDWSQDSLPERACVKQLEQWIGDTIVAQNPNPAERGGWEQNVKIVLWRSAAAAATDDVRNAGPHDDSSESTGGISAYEEDARLQRFIVGRLSMATYFIRSSYPPPEWYRTGVGAALLYGAVRERPNAKIADHELRQRAARQQASLGVHESLLTKEGPSGTFEVTEGSRSNLIVVDPDGRVLCAPTSDILLGITLLAVRRECRQRAIPFEHRILTLRDIVGCAALAMTGTSPGVLPLSKVVVFSSEDEENALLTALGVAEDTAGGHDDEKTLRQKKEDWYRQAGITVTERTGDGDSDAPARCGWQYKSSANHPTILTLVEAYQTTVASPASLSDVETAETLSPG